MSMLGSAHCFAKVVPPVAGVWPKYTATFREDCALKMYSDVESAESPWAEDEGTATGPEEVSCAKIAPWVIDAAESEGLDEPGAESGSGITELGAAKLATVPDAAAAVTLGSGAAVPGAAVFGKNPDGTKAEAIAVLEAATLVFSGSPVTVATASDATTVVCSTAVEIAPDPDTLDVAEAISGTTEPAAELAAEPATELGRLTSMDEGEGEEMEITCSPSSPIKTVLGSVESRCPFILYSLISRRTSSSIACSL